jgi:hypothetical protein
MSVPPRRAGLGGRGDDVRALLLQHGQGGSQKKAAFARAGVRRTARARRGALSVAIQAAHVLVLPRLLVVRADAFADARERRLDARRGLQCAARAVAEREAHALALRAVPVVLDCIVHPE